MSLSVLDKHMQERLRSGATVSSVSQCVQELVENSIDAGAKCITVHIDMRRYRIKVLDNGSGITYDDLKLIGERYSTSKCHSLADLENLKFCGFRGEALASIIALAGTVDISSRHKLSSQTYTKVFCNSKSLDVIPCYQSRPTPGTTVTVHDFLYNLPVRRLGTVEVLEMDKLQKLMECITLINPSCSFLINNDATGECVFKAQKTGSILSSFSQLFGSDKTVSMKEVSCSHACFYVHGYISSEGYHNKSLQFLYVNGRIVKKTALHSCVNNILVKFFRQQAQTLPHSMMEVFKYTPEKHGMYILLVECPRMEYDICFEPTKTLIEFKNWDKLLAAVEQLVGTFARKYVLESSSSADREGSCATTEFGDGAVPCCTVSCDLQFHSALCSDVIQRKSKITHEGSAQVSTSRCMNTRSKEAYNKSAVDSSTVETCRPESHELHAGEIFSFPVRQADSRSIILDSLQDCKSRTKLSTATSNMQSRSSQVLCSSLHSNVSRKKPVLFSNEKRSDSYLQVHTTSQHACTQNLPEPEVCEAFTSTTQQLTCSNYVVPSHDASSNVSTGIAIASPSSLPVNCLPPVTGMFGLKAVVRSPLLSSAVFSQTSKRCEPTWSPKHALRKAVAPVTTSIATTSTPPLVCSTDTVIEACAASMHYPPSSFNTKVGVSLVSSTSKALNSSTLLAHDQLIDSYSKIQQTECGISNVIPHSSLIRPHSYSETAATPALITHKPASTLGHVHIPEADDTLPVMISVSTSEFQCEQTQSTTNSNTDILSATVSQPFYFDQATSFSQSFLTATAIHSSTASLMLGSSCHQSGCNTASSTPMMRIPYVRQRPLSGSSTFSTRHITLQSESGAVTDVIQTGKVLLNNAKYRNSAELEEQCQNVGETSMTQFLHLWENPVFNSGDGEILNVGFSGNTTKTQIQLHSVVNKHTLSRSMFQNVKVIGQVDCKFIACLMDSKQAGCHDLLLMVDQHAAHERVRLETLSADMYECACQGSCQTGACSTSKIKSSVVQPPIPVSLKPADVKLARMFRKQLENIGISMLFEGSKLLVTSIPSLLMEREVSERKRGRPAIATSIIQELIVKHLELLRTTSGSFNTQPPTISKVLNSQACHGAIKFGDPLSLEECRSLIQQLSKCKLPFQCAHGRPSVIPLVDLNLLDERYPTEKCVSNFEKCHGIIGNID